MTSPLEGQPGETAEQRKARFAAANRVQQRIDAEMRAEEAARVKKASTPPTPKALPANPFTDPNYASRQLNEYFGSLRKDYGEGAIRGAGFTPRDLSLMQASLRKLQMDPSATPEQHRQAYQQARDALAQRITTPLAAAQPMLETARPEIPVTPPTPMPAEVGPMPYSILRNPGAAGTLTPSQSQLNAFYAAGGEGARGSETIWNPYTGAFEKAQYSQPTSAAVTPQMAVPVTPPVPSATDYISGLNGSGSNEIVATQPGILPGITQQQPAAPSMNTQPGADFDRNVARQIFDAEFRTLREKYGDQGLRSAGFTPRTLSALQAPLTNVQKDNTISYDQSSAALEDALKQLRGYNFGGAQPAAPAPMTAPVPSAPLPVPAGAQQSPIPGYYRGGPAMRYR